MIWRSAAEISVEYQIPPFIVNMAIEQGVITGGKVLLGRIRYPEDRVQVFLDQIEDGVVDG